MNLRNIFNMYDIDNDNNIDCDGFKHIINILELPIINIDQNKQYSYEDLINYIKTHHNIKTINIQKLKVSLNTKLDTNDTNLLISEMTGDNNKIKNINSDKINEYLDKFLIQ